MTRLYGQARDVYSALAGQNAGVPASPGRVEVIMTTSADGLTAAHLGVTPDDIAGARRADLSFQAWSLDAPAEIGAS
jgi:hypothetical protein